MQVEIITLDLVDWGGTLKQITLRLGLIQLLAMNIHSIQIILIVAQWL